MASLQSRCLDGFPAWLRSLPDDARALAELLDAHGDDAVGRAAAAALTYLFKSLDLIPDGLEDLGYLDDVFVLRAAALGVGAGDRARDASGALERLAADAELVREFLGDDFAKLEAYASGLESGSARGRSAREVAADAALRAEFTRDVRRWADAFVVPAFARDEKNLVKLRAFLVTRLSATR